MLGEFGQDPNEETYSFAPMGPGGEQLTPDSPQPETTVPTIHISGKAARAGSLGAHPAVLGLGALGIFLALKPSTRMIGLLMVGGAAYMHFKGGISAPAPPAV